MHVRTGQRSNLIGFARFVAAAVAVATLATAQCQTQWVGVGTFGLDGAVASSTLWDPDGSGPLAARLVVGGSFTEAGNVTANGAAAYDLGTQTWSALGSLPDIVALAASPAGSLFAASGSTVQAWNGSAWQILGSGMNGAVNTIALMPNGDLLAGGAFTNAGGTATNGFARWNGTVWQSLGSGVPIVVEALLPLPNGQVLGAATFTVSGAPLRYLARWNGLGWTFLGNSVNGTVKSLALLSNGDYVAAGDFTAIGATSRTRVARWNGSTWQSMASGLGSTVKALLPLPNGLLIAGGSFLSTTTGPNRIATWDGSAWRSFPASPSGDVGTMTMLPTGRVAVGGEFTSAGTTVVNNLAQWTGAEWQQFGLEWQSAPSIEIRSLATMPNSDLLAAGVGTPYSYSTIYRWDGAAWSWFALVSSGGVSGPPDTAIHALTALRNGDVLAGGSFIYASWGATTPVRCIVRYVGGTPTPLASGMNGTVRAVIEMPNGDIIAGGDFTTAGGSSANRVARWNGSTWSPLGAGMNDSVRALAVLPNGNIVAGGLFTTADGNSASHVASWNGSTWAPLGAGTNGETYALTMHTNGDLIAGGAFTTAGAGPANHVARWDGSSWSPLGSGLGTTVNAFTHGSNGDLVAGGVDAVARWDGLSWHGYDIAPGVAPATVYALAERGETLIVGGSRGVFYDDRICPGSATITGAGCVGTGGLIQTTVLPHPWLGFTSQSHTTGLAASAFAFVVFGFTNPNLQLANLHSLGGQGCGLYASIDVVYLMFPLLGEVDTTLTIPNDAAFAGLTLFHQIVEFELDGNGSTIGIHSGNGLRLEVATF